MFFTPLAPFKGKIRSDLESLNEKVNVVNRFQNIRSQSKERTLKKRVDQGRQEALFR